MSDAPAIHNREDDPGDTFHDVWARRMARRSFLTGALAGVPLALFGPSLLSARATVPSGRRNLSFDPISLSTEDRVLVPAGYTHQIVLRWGDPLFQGAPELDVEHQSKESQEQQFGYNCDFVGFFPLPDSRSKNSFKGLLAVNHEYTNPDLMFPGYSANPTREQVDVELAAHGMSMVEIERHVGGAWRYKVRSGFNRRITGETEMRITGPAAGHAWLKVSYDPTGTKVRGMLNNCAGGKTPWGTVLTCEENFDQYFANRNSLPDEDPRTAIHARYGLPTGASQRKWERYHDRFDLAKEPNEPFRFGWVVEIDPYDPHFTPRKRTALGRIKHEAATVVVRNKNVVVYSGDDERFNYVYKFVSRRRLSSTRSENVSLLDEGTLYVAKFSDDGTGAWLPLIGGQGLLADWSHAEVLINTRGAADALGATKMDRPEDIETNPVNGKVYCVMTNNTQRGTAGRPGVDGPNPRPVDRYGHIIELTEEGNDPASTTFRWEIFMLCGDPVISEHGTSFGRCAPNTLSPISSPDNIAFDQRGNLWIATDGQPGTIQKNDAVFAVPVEGGDRGCLHPFLSGPNGAEVCGPEFTPDNHTFFCSIQHPGEGGTPARPLSTWPDGTPYPKPSVVAVVKTNTTGSKVIGS